MADNKQAKLLLKAQDELYSLTGVGFETVTLVHIMTGLACRMAALEAVLEKNQVIAPGAVNAEFNLFMETATETTLGQIKTIKGALGKK